MTSYLSAILAALGAAFFLALAAALQQRGAASVPGRRTLHPALILSLLRQPGWLAGILVGLLGVGFQVMALRWGPLALVQPVGVTTLLFALPIGAALQGKGVSRPEMYAAVVVALGLGGLLLTLDPASGTPSLDQARLTALAVIVAAGVVGCVLVAFRLRATGRTLLLATGAGASFGTTAALVQVLVHRAAGEGISVFASWLTLVAGAFSVAGFVLSQGAYKSGRLSIALAAILVVDPLAAVGAGAFALHEDVSTTLPVLVVAEAALIVTGVVVLSRAAAGASDRPAPSQPTGRVLIGADTYPPDVNGAAHFAHRLACGLAARGRDVHVVAPSPSRESYRETHAGVTVHRLPSRGTPFHPSFRLCPFPGREVERVVAQVRPAVIHTQSHFLVGRALSAAARRTGTPLVATNHFMPENLLPYLPARSWLGPVVAAAAWRDLSRILSRAYAVTTPTPIAAQLAREKGFRRPVTPISCGVDLERFAARDDRRSPALFGLPDRSTLLFVGRLDAEKRIQDLVDALPVVLGRLDAQLAVAGIGTRRAELEERARRLGVADRVHFLGYVPEERLPSLYTIADVFCMPGVAELQSLVTLEAMASGRPVVAADAMALPHLVRSGRNGFRYEPGDTRTLAGHLIALLGDPGLRRGMGRVSAAIAAEHDVTRSLDRFEELYDEAAGAVRKSAKSKPGETMQLTSASVSPAG